jgi:hypothetical protein
MVTISFKLTMPNNNAWNGKWTGQDRNYYIIKTLTKKSAQHAHFKDLMDKGRDSWYYNFGDGWGACVIAELIDGKEARRRRKLTVGFSGYDWMVSSILTYGEILNDRQRKERAQQQTATV